MREYLRKKHQMQHFTKECKQSKPVSGNINNDITMLPKAKRM